MIEALKTYAKAHHIPIITDDGLLFIQDVIKTHEIKDVLEIGTAIGYSAIAMALFGAKVDTIERNTDMQMLAKSNIAKHQLNHKVHLICADAITCDLPLKMYDMIFIDAAKAQYQLFFDKFSSCLKPEGIIVCDNLDFHHLDPATVNRNTRQLIRKIDHFKTYLKTHPLFETKYLNIGDGMSISKRRQSCT